MTIWELALKKNDPISIGNIFLSILGYPCFRKLPHWYPWLNKKTSYFCRAHCWSHPKNRMKPNLVSPHLGDFSLQAVLGHTKTHHPPGRCMANATTKRSPKRFFHQVSAKSAKKSASEQEAWRVMRVGLVGGSGWCFKKTWLMTSLIDMNDCGTLMIQQYKSLNSSVYQCVSIILFLEHKA